MKSSRISICESQSIVITIDYNRLENDEMVTDCRLFKIIQNSFEFSNSEVNTFLGH